MLSLNLISHFSDIGTSQRSASIKCDLETPQCTNTENGHFLCAAVAVFLNNKISTCLYILFFLFNEGGKKGGGGKSEHLMGL